MAPASGPVSGAGTADTHQLYGSRRPRSFWWRPAATGFAALAIATSLFSMTGHPGVIVTLDGEVHPPGTPLLFADDLAAVRGDGVFETLLVRDGRACLIEAHLGRLTHSAKLLDLPEPDLAAWRQAIELATRQWVGGTDAEAAMRLVYSRGRERGSAPTAYVTVNPVADRIAATRRDGLAAVTLPRELPSAGVEAMPWLLAGAKTLSYAINMAALRHAERQGAGDVVFVSSDGHVLEGPRSTVVIATRRRRRRSQHVSADPTALVSDPARHHTTGIVRRCPRQGLRLRLPRSACRRSVCCARGLVGVEHDAGCARAHPGRPGVATGSDGGGIRRTRRRGHRQRPLKIGCRCARERVRSAVHREGGGPRN